MLLLNNVCISTHKTNKHMCAVYWQRNELLYCAHDLMLRVSADRNASCESSQNAALTNIKTIAKLQALHV